MVDLSKETDCLLLFIYLFILYLLSKVVCSCLFLVNMVIRLRKKLNREKIKPLNGLSKVLQGLHWWIVDFLETKQRGVGSVA